MKRVIFGILAIVVAFGHIFTSDDLKDIHTRFKVQLALSQTLSIMYLMEMLGVVE